MTSSEKCGKYAGDPDACHGNAVVGGFFVVAVIIVILGLVAWRVLMRRYEKKGRKQSD